MCLCVWSFRLELLLQRANKVQNMALECEEKLTLAKNTLQAVSTLLMFQILFLINFLHTYTGSWMMPKKLKSKLLSLTTVIFFLFPLSPLHHKFHVV